MFIVHYCTYTLCFGSADVIGANTHLPEQCSKLPVLRQTQWTSQTQQHSLALSQKMRKRITDASPRAPTTTRNVRGILVATLPTTTLLTLMHSPHTNCEGPTSHTPKHSVTKCYRSRDTYIHTYIHTGSLAPTGWGPTCMYYQNGQSVSTTHTCSALQQNRHACVLLGTCITLLRTLKGELE